MSWDGAVHVLQIVATSFIPQADAASYQCAVPEQLLLICATSNKQVCYVDIACCCYDIMSSFFEACLDVVLDVFRLIGSWTL